MKKFQEIFLTFGLYFLDVKILLSRFYLKHSKLPLKDSGLNVLSNFERYIRFASLLRYFSALRL